MAATPGARGVILRTDITEPSNFRATRHLDQWLQARAASSGSAGLDTRALTALIREKGMPNAVIAHDADRQVRSRRAEEGSARVAGPRRHGPRADGDQRPALHLGRDAVAVGQGLRPARQAGIPRGRDRLRHQAQHPAAARQRRLQGHGGAGEDLGRGHPRAQARRRVPLQRSRRSGGDRAIRGAGDPEADRLRHAHLRHLPRPPDARHRGRRQDHEDAPGPSRRQPSGARTSPPARSRSPR